MNKCKGCGITLQNNNTSSLGYTTTKENQICERCFKLKNYGQYSNVTLNNEDYLKIIHSITKENLVIYTTDILNLAINNINNFKKIIIVVTKKDILPKSTKDAKIINYIKKRYQNVIDVIIISSIKNYNLDYLYNQMQKHSDNFPVYIVGNTNSGKSTLINKLIDNYSKFDNPKVTTSMFPSTTLDKVEINLGDVKLIDTPGLIDQNSLINNLSTKELKNITPKKEIKPKSCQINSRGSLVIGNFARVDYETSTNNSLVIYTSNALEIRFSSLNKEVSENFSKTDFNLKDHQDIVIPGLGFIKFVGPIKVSIYCSKNIKPYSRDNLI